MKKYSTEADQGGLMAVRIRFCDLRLAVRLLLRRGCGAGGDKCKIAPQIQDRAESESSPEGRKCGAGREKCRMAPQIQDRAESEISPEGRKCGAGTRKSFTAPHFLSGPGRSGQAIPSPSAEDALRIPAGQSVSFHRKRAAASLPIFPPAVPG